jgi:hypothetical protein
MVNPESTGVVAAADKNVRSGRSVPESLKSGRGAVGMLSCN